jgi:hypothetical protein
LLKNSKQSVVQAINTSFGNSSSDIARSDIYKSLQELARNVVAPSRAKNKTVFIVSDMLENSSVSSFYANNGVRLIDPKAEIAKAEKRVCYLILVAQKFMS